MQRVKILSLILILIALLCSCANQKRNPSGDLSIAVLRGDEKAVRASLERGADANKDEVLLTALNFPKLNIVEILLENGADPNTSDSFGTTALMKSVWGGHVEIIKLLLKKGADVNAIDSHGTTALLMVANIGGWAARLPSFGYFDIPQILIDHGADVNYKNPNTGDTALMGSSQTGDIHATKILLKNGADVNEKNIRGENALALAAEKDHVEIVKVLLENGADVNTKMSNGETVLMWASSKGYSEIVKALIENKVVVARQVEPLEDGVGAALTEKQESPRKRQNTNTMKEDTPALITLDNKTATLTALLLNFSDHYNIAVTARIADVNKNGIDDFEITYICPVGDLRDLPEEKVRAPFFTAIEHYMPILETELDWKVDQIYIYNPNITTIGRYRISMHDCRKFHAYLKSNGNNFRDANKKMEKYMHFEDYLMPDYRNELKGSCELKIINPTRFKVGVGMRDGDKGVNFEVEAGAQKISNLPLGKYKIYFVYGNKPHELIEGNPIAIKDRSSQIEIGEWLDGSYKTIAKK